MSETTTVYLACFRAADGSKARLAHAGHYLGSTARPEQDRLGTHLAGHGSPLVAAAVAAGLTAVITRTWPGGRVLERQLKNQHNSPRLCPSCKLSAAEEMTR